MPIDPRTGQEISEEEYRRLLAVPVSLASAPPPMLAPAGELAIDPTTGQAVDPQTLAPAWGPDTSVQGASQKVADKTFEGLARGGNLAMWDVMGLPLRATVGAGEAAAKDIGQTAGELAGDVDAGTTRGGQAAQTALSAPYDIVKGALASALERPGSPQTYRDLLAEAGAPKDSDAAIAGGAALDLLGDPLQHLHFDVPTAAGEGAENPVVRGIDTLGHASPGGPVPPSPEWSDLASGGELSGIASEPTWLARARRHAGNAIFGNENRSVDELLDALEGQRASGQPIELQDTPAEQAAAGQRTAVSFAGRDITPDWANQTIYGAAEKAGDIAEAARDLAPESLRTNAYKMFGDTTGHPGFDEAERVGQATKIAQEGDYAADINRLKNKLDDKFGDNNPIRDAIEKEIVALATEPTQQIRDLGASNRQLDNVLEAMGRRGVPIVNLYPDEAEAAAASGRLPGNPAADAQTYRDLLFDEGPTSARLYATRQWLGSPVADRQLGAARANLLGRILDTMAYYRQPLQDGVNQYWATARTGNVPDDVLLDPNLTPSFSVRDAALDAIKIARKMHDDDVTAGLPAAALSGRLGYYPHVADPELLKFAEDIGAKPGMQRGGILEDPNHASMRPRGIRDQTPEEINDPTNLQNDLAQYAGIPLGVYTGPIVSEDPIHALSVRARRSAKAQGAMAYIDEIAKLSQPPAATGQPAPGNVNLPEYLQGLGLRVPQTTMDRLDGVQIPEDAAKVVASRVGAIYDNPANPTWGQSALNAWDQAQRWWKGKSTLGRGPGYSLGNLADSLVQNYEAGTADPAYMLPAARIVAAARSDPEALRQPVYVPSLDRQIPMQELVRQMRLGRVLTGGWLAADPQMPHGGDEPYLGIPALADAAKNVATGQGSVMNLARRTPLLASLIPGENLSPTRQLSATLAEYADEMPRVAHYLQRLDAGDSLDQAAQSVRDTLYDYGAATDFERNLLKRADLFYTWPRRNIPAQLSVLAHDPGKIAAIVKGVHDYEMAQPPPTKPEEYDAQKFEGRFPVWGGRTDYAGPRGTEPDVGQVSVLGRYLPPTDISPFFDAAVNAGKTALGSTPLNQQGQPMGTSDMLKRLGHQILEGAEPGDQSSNPLIDVLNYAGGNNWDKARHRFIDPLADLKERNPQIAQSYPDTPGTFLGLTWGGPGERYAMQKLNPDLNIVDAWNPSDVFGTHTEPGIFGNTRLSRQDLPAPERDMRFATGIASYPIGTRLDASMANQDYRDAIGKYRSAVRQNRAIGLPPDQELEQRIAFRNALRQLRSLRQRGGEPITASEAGE